MYDLPLIETTSLLPPGELFLQPEVIEFFGPDLKVAEISAVKKHVLTHQRLYVRLVILQNQPLKLKEQWFYTSVEALKKLAIPKIVFIFIKNIFNL